MGFVREHWRPLTGAAALHVVLLVLVVIAAWNWPRSEPPQQLAIEGVVVDARDLPASRAQPQSEPVPPQEQAPEPQPVPPTETVDQAQEEAKAAAEKAAQEAAERERALELEREAEEARAAEAQRLAAEEEQRKREAAEEAQRKAEAAERERQELEAKRRQDAEAAAAKRRQAELQRSIEAEEEANAVARSGVVDEYRRMLTAAIERNWNRPPSARPGLQCMLYVTQAPGGTVIDVRLGACNGDQAVRESITNAVFRASPLPPPPDARAFERRLEINFEPKE
jgi:colicin import membrane protein